MGFGGTANLQIIITAIDKASGTFNKVGNSLAATGAKMKSVGKGMTMGLTLPLVGIAAMAIKVGADFDKSMAKTRAVTGATTEQFAKLSDMAKEMGRTTMFSASQVADAMSFMGMAGMETDQIMDSLNDTLNLAAAGGLEMSEAANIVTNVMAGFGIETKDLSKAVDVMSKAFTSSNVDLSMLGESMKYAGPVAHGVGMSFEETTAIIGSFGNAGIQASMAGTTLRQAIIQLNKKAEGVGVTIYNASGKMLPFADIMEQIEKKGWSAGEIMEFFGARAGPGMLALLETGSKGLREFTTELENSGGTAEQIAKVQMEGLHGQMIKFKSAVEGMMISIKEALMPVLTPLIGKLTSLARRFADLSPTTQKIIVMIALFVAALGPMLWIGGLLITNLKGIGAAIKGVGIAMKFLSAHPLILAIMAVIAVGLYMWKHWDEIKEGLKIVWEAISNTAKVVFEGIANFLKFWGEAVKTLFTTIGNFLKGVLIVWKEVLRPIWQPIVEASESLFNFLSDWIEKISDFVYEKWTAVGNVLKGVWNAISNAFTAFLNPIKDAWGKTWNWVVEKVQWVLDKIKAIVNNIKGVLSPVTDLAKGIGEGIKGFGQNIWGGMKSLVGIGAGTEAFKTYQSGGVVPGIGAQLAMVHGGETIIPRGKGLGDVNIYIQGGNYLDRDAGEKFADILGKMLRRELRY